MGRGTGVEDGAVDVDNVAKALGVRGFNGTG
jgi:hypothetical protein